MSDHRVIALFYKILPDPSVDYREAEPCDYEEDNFSVQIKKEQVCFTMKAHYTTVEKAREAVRDYIQRWEVDVSLPLQGEPSAFKLAYEGAQIENQKIGLRKMAVMDPLFSMRTVHSKRYPPRPSAGLRITPDVQRMFDRFTAYRSGRELLPAMAYFCLTVLEKSTGEQQQRRQAAAEKYGIDFAVLDKIGSLSTRAGGQQARKASGISRELTSSETRFLEKAMAALIRRAAEVARDPTNKGRDEIKLSDLPELV